MGYGGSAPKPVEKEKHTFWWFMKAFAVLTMILIVGAGLFFAFWFAPIPTGIVLWVMGLPIYMFLAFVEGAQLGPRLGEPNPLVLWIIWWPLYGPWRLYRWFKEREVTDE